MSEKRFVIGTDVRCTDGVAGRLYWVVVDPAERKVTHLAVKPGGLMPGRLVPAGQVESTGTEIVLRCTTAEFARFEGAEETSQEPAPHDLRGRGSGADSIEQDTGYGNRTVTRDRIPAGGVEVRRGEPVYAVDGEAGRLYGMAVDLDDGQQRIKRLLIEAGHLWKRTRVAVPAGSTTRFGDGIQIDLTKNDVRALPREGSKRDG